MTPTETKMSLPSQSQGLTQDAPTLRRPVLLPRYLALVYLALVVYASLHPFSGWRDPGLSPFSFLDASWPRYWTVFDLTINAVAYLPLGFFLALAFRRLPGRWTPILAGLAVGATISFALECLQTWLPSRVPSNIDWASNSLGAAVGALLAFRLRESFFGGLALIQGRLLAPVPHAELGLVLVGLWLLTQLTPETLLFGAGDLRHILDITPAVPYAAHSFIALETLIIVCNTVAIGLIVRALLSSQSTPYPTLAGFFALALLIRAFAASILVGPLQAMAWFTPGAGLGLLAGWIVLSIALLLPASLRIALAGLGLMASTVLVNLTPPNPYSAVALATWRQGHFLNFNGLTRLAASFWPFLALPYLTIIARRP